MVFIGFVGAINLFLFFPGILIWNYTGLEKFEAPSNIELAILFCNALVGTMISDLLWAYSVRLLNPALCTMGLSLTIPLAMVVDIFLHGTYYGPIYITGTLLILIGFIIMCIFEHPTWGVYLTNSYIK